MEKPTVEQMLKQMEQNMGEKPRPMIAMSKVIPEMVFRQAQDSKFVFELPNIPAKYKHLIMVAVAAVCSSPQATVAFVKIAIRSGATKEEIAEAIVTARLALANTVFVSATEGLEYLTRDG